MSTSQSKCPECGGNKTHFSHQILRDGTPDGWKWSDCQFCDGTGQVEAEKADRWETGQKLREDRRARGLTLRDEAKRLGISPRELGDLEWGRTPS